jgi:hypothetical protein
MQTESAGDGASAQTLLMQFNSLLIQTSSFLPSIFLGREVNETLRRRDEISADAAARRQMTSGFL